MPAILAVAFWLQRIIHHGSLIGESFFNISISSYKTTPMQILLQRIGFDKHILHNLQTSLVTNMFTAHGYIGAAMLLLSFYFVVRKHKFISDNTSKLIDHLYLFLPCIMYHLIFIEHASTHEFFSATFRPALVISFVLLPIFILQLLKKSHLMHAFYVANKKSITIVASTSLISSVLYAYTSVHGSSPITKRFSPPNYQHVIVGNFVRDNTSYRDVVFCQDHYTSGDTFPHDLTAAFFYNKLLHYAHNLDHIYHKVRAIEQDFIVRILYYKWRRQEIEQLAAFLEHHNVAVDDMQKEKIGGLLGFDGREFIAWYEKTHACDEHPYRCHK